MKFSANSDYTQSSQFTINLGHEQLELVANSGFPSWNSVSAAIQLFLHNAIISPGDHALLYGCHQGALAAYLTRTVPQLTLNITDHNHTCLEMARLTLQANQISNITCLSSIELPNALYHSFNLIYIQLPKSRSLIRRWLVQAYHALEVDGSLYLAGAKEAGIQSAIKDARSLFNNGAVLSYKKGNRLARFIKFPGDDLVPDWSRNPGISPGTWVEFTVRVNHHTFQIRSLPGVFSYNQVDEGTRLLLETVPIPNGSKVLDVGCGYGLIGLFAAAQGASLVHLVDNDLLAVASCNQNLNLNKIDCAQVFAGDLLSPINAYQYDLVLSNPPFHAGHAVDYHVTEALIKQSYQALNPGGKLVIVVNRFLRYDPLIQSVFGNISVLAESGKFRLLSGLKSRVIKKGK
jgi:16S rRNA (guanine1207-N2)-methyltransferase